MHDYFMAHRWSDYYHLFLLSFYYSIFSIDLQISFNPADLSTEAAMRHPLTTVSGVLMTDALHFSPVTGSFIW